MVIRKCLVYNLDLFASRGEERIVCNCWESVGLLLLALRSSNGNSKVEKDLWLECVSSLLLRSFTRLLPHARLPLAQNG